MIGIYVVTALVHTAPAVPATVLIYALAAITWCVLGDRYAALCGVLAAIGGPVVEAVLAKAGLFRYAERLRRAVRGGAMASGALLHVRRRGGAAR